MPRPSPRVVLLSGYELGHQPVGLATPFAFFERAGLSPRAFDLAVEPFDRLDPAEMENTDFLLVATPMHTALRLGIELLPKLRALAPRARIAFFGLYAHLNRELLRSLGVDFTVSGECEEELVSWVVCGAAGNPDGSAVLDRLDFPVPSRGGLPSLDRYARLELPGGMQKLVGAVETTRGCLHSCRHCPIPPVYRGRFFAVPKETVLADIRQLVEAGARHIDFVDPDFLNGPRHALAVAREMAAAHPGLTFNFTAKVEHLVRHRRHLRELAELGALFVVTAVESLSDRVLDELSKGHRREDVFEALERVRESGMAFRPTFLPFTPWTERSDYLELLQWIGQERLVGSVDPIQLCLRLLIPPGSLLLENPSLTPHLRGLDAEALTFRWEHPDPGMDVLEKEALRWVEESLGAGRTDHETFHGFLELATGSRELSFPPLEPPGPRLTEAWFC